MSTVRSAVAAFAALSMLAAGCGESASSEEFEAPTVVDEPVALDTGDDDPDDGANDVADDGPVEEPPADDMDGDGEAPVADGMLEVHFIDVGQANATLLLHDDVTMLIDQGDWRRNDVVPYLRSVGIDHLDVVVTSHPHADHIGQFPDVLDAFTVDEVWWSGAVSTSQTFERALDALDASTAAYAEPRAGDTTEVGPLLVEFVAPTDTGARASNLNDTSLAKRISYGEVRFLLTGDAEAGVEARMVRDHADVLDAEVYLAGHHGASTSTTPAFLEAVDPTVTVYSAGAGNSYGHPHADVLDRLAAHRTEVYGTDVNGTVVVTTDGVTVEVTVERDGTPGSGSPAGTGGDDPDTAGDEPDVPATSAGDGSCAAGQVDVNSASPDELQQIIHIGPDRARDIVADRPFSSVQSLTRLSGIGPARIADIIGQGVACAS